MTVVPFKSLEDKKAEERRLKIVGRLEQLLADAKAGKITALAYVLITSDKKTVNSWIGSPRRLREQIAVLWRRVKDATAKVTP